MTEEAKAMGTHNTLGDLTNHLFAELERLGDESMNQERMKGEIERARAITGVAQQVIANANTMLRAVEFKDSAISSNASVPRMLTDGDD